MPLVQIRPLRDWNTAEGLQNYRTGSVQIRPLRDWNTSWVWHGRQCPVVQIRPLRDWNYTMSNLYLPEGESSNQTVAGLKPRLLSLPFHSFPLFKSDRCGIETHIHCYVQYLLIIVQIRPLRDWNQRYYKWCSNWCTVQIRPLRDWNLPSDLRRSDRIRRSNQTVAGLKLFE